MRTAPIADMQEHREFHLARRVRRYRIVVALDLSEYSEAVLEHALDQAARHESPELHLLTVRERRRPDADTVKEALWEHVYPTLQEFNRHGLDWHARLHVRRGKPHEQIVELAAEVGADLVVMGQFGRHHKSRHARRTLPKLVLESAVCPTLIVGLPAAYDARQCPLCVAVREQTEGEDWFCDDHHARAKRTQVTPMTVWIRGRFTIERAA